MKKSKNRMGDISLTKPQERKILPRKGSLLWQSSFPTLNENRLKTIGEIKRALKKESIKIALSDYEFLLILDEAITNSMEHGHRWNKKKSIDVEIRKGHYTLFIYIKDEGKGFNVDNIPKFITQKLNLSPRGRGIYIMSYYCRLLWNSIGNELCICIKLKKET